MNPVAGTLSVFTHVGMNLGHARFVLYSLRCRSYFLPFLPFFTGAGFPATGANFNGSL